MILTTYSIAQIKHLTLFQSVKPELQNKPLLPLTNFTLKNFSEFTTTANESSVGGLSPLHS